MTETRTAAASHGTGDRQKAGSPPARGESGIPPKHVIVRLAAGAALVVLLSTAAAFGVGLLQPTAYEARSEIVLELGEVATQAQADRVLSSVVVMATSRAVLEPAAAELEIGVAEAEAFIDAAVLENSQVIRIEATSEEPTLSRDLVEGVTAALVSRVGDEQAEDDAGVSGPSGEFISQQIDELTAEREDIEQRLAELDTAREEAIAQGEPPPATSEYRLLTARSETISTRLAGLHERLLELELESATLQAPVEILTPAYLVEATDRNRPQRAAAIGALVGIALGTAVFVGGWNLTRRQRSNDTMHEAL